MFGCCGCPSKKTDRKASEDEDEEKEKAAPEENDGVKRTLTEKVEVQEVIVETIPGKKISTESIAENGAPSAEVSEKITEIVEENFTVKDVSSGRLSGSENAEDTGALVVTTSVPSLPNVGFRKPSLKQPKPRLSISTEVKIIPSGLDVDETEEDAQSPLSDEVFAGEGSDPPRANLGVSPVGVLGALGVDFPRSPVLEVPLSPRGKAPTPHPKRASMPAVLPRWLSEDDDEGGGLLEPPVTPVAKDELALRRHRFFAELLAAAQAATEHRVRFDPLGPEVREESDSASKELEALLDRLEKITSRLEKAVPILENSLEPLTRSIVVTKSLEDLLDEHLTPTEKEKISGLISDKLISPDSSADVADLSDRELVPELCEYDVLNNEDAPLHRSEDEETDYCNPEASLPELPFGVDPADSPDSRHSKRDLSNGKNGDTTGYSSLEEGDTTEKSREGIKDDLSTDLSETKLQDLDNRGEIIGEEFQREENGEASDLVEEIVREGDLSDTEGSSDSPDTVVGESSPNGRASPEETPASPNMTNSQSTLSMSVQGFQSIIQGPLASYLQLSAQIGGDVAEHAKLVQGAFQAQLQYLSQASQSRKPSTAEEQQLLQPTSQFIQAIQEFREKHRSSPLFNHLSAISESIPALGWVAVSPAPSPFVKEMNDAGQFYTNRVLKDWKEKDKKHVEWTKSWVGTLSELQGFVKQHHTTGLVWSGTAAARSGAPPPPPSGPMPPPPPPLDLNLGDLDLGTASNDRNALFAEINRGTDVTKGLKKVTSDMQTHKNPAIRTGPAPFKAPAPQPNQNARAPAASADKPPVFTRDGKKWLVEYQKGNHGLVVEGAEMNNVVYVFRCSESTVTVKGKINSIFLDSCKKTAVVFDSVVSSVEFVNCQSVQMQVLGTVPTISIDKTDGCQMYLSDGSLAVEIVSSKSSEMNVLVPKGNGDFAEHPIPEQFRTTVTKKGLTTTAVESTG